MRVNKLSRRNPGTVEVGGIGLGSWVDNVCQFGIEILLCRRSGRLGLSFYDSPRFAPWAIDIPTFSTAQIKITSAGHVAADR